MIEVGRLIVEQRKKMGLRQAELARRIGVKREYLSKIETGGLPNPTLKTIEKITGGLGISVGELLLNN